ncbi:hypothetical protein [Microvirga aerophila]|uniref:Uncharacterized protein n=1 Tax=Microvirga aerophila TaxID=670291 RepID=A0A512C0P7_9HYPH|nr:hypothetical protein [Microvirga aerophila]GEO17786.1 hypothetical protein MAE02_54820 [Microvirga aerophila]
MRNDSIFYVMAKSKPEVPRGSETASYEELCVWLVQKLCFTGPKERYIKPLVDFAELILDECPSGLSPHPEDYDLTLGSILGQALKMSTHSEETREFSSAGMEFVGRIWEATFLNVECLEVPEICEELIGFLQLKPDYFRQVRRRGKNWIKGTKRFRQESGLKVMLEAPDWGFV